MILNFYGWEVNVPFTSWSSIVNIKNTLWEDLEFEFEWEWFILKKSKSQAYPAKIWAFVASEIAKRKLAKEDRAFSDPRYKTYFLECFWSDEIAYEDMWYAELKEEAKAKWLEISTEEWKLKTKKALIEELSNK